MNASPVDLALKHVVETKRLLETLILSSESFDYPKAKAALKELEKKKRELARAQAELSGQKQPSLGNVTVIDFRAVS